MINLLWSNKQNKYSMSTTQMTGGGQWYLLQNPNCMILAMYAKTLKKLNIEETPSFSKRLPECEDSQNEDVSYVREDCEGEDVEVVTSNMKKRKKIS